MLTGRLIPGRLFSSWMSPGLSSKAMTDIVWLGENLEHVRIRQISVKEMRTEESVSVWDGISLDKLADLYVFPQGTVNAQTYSDDFFHAYMHCYAGKRWSFCTKKTTTLDHILLASWMNMALIVDDYIQKEIFYCMEWSSRWPAFNCIEHVWDGLGRRISALNPPPLTRLALLYRINDSHFLRNLKHHTSLYVLYCFQGGS